MKPFILVLSFSVIACTMAETPTDPGGTDASGADAATDAGPLLDAGDAGVTVDAGDAGVTVDADAGVGSGDAGVDAGNAGVDAGPYPCDGPLPGWCGSGKCSDLAPSCFPTWTAGCFCGTCCQCFDGQWGASVTDCGVPPDGG